MRNLRDRLICWLAKKGVPKPTIARLFHVSRQRVYQIINDRKRRRQLG
jgi:DNA invertase Pin-like site-specific DNA recombinase